MPLKLFPPNTRFRDIIPKMSPFHPIKSGICSTAGLRNSLPDALTRLQKQFDGCVNFFRTDEGTGKPSQLR